MTTPILNILEINAQPPYGVGLLELDRLQRDLTAIYERLTKDDREVLLEKDFRALLSAHVSAKVDIRALEQKRLAMLHPGRNVEDLKRIQYGIERIASHLLRIADGLNARLSKSLIERFSNYNGESETKFYEIIKWAYIATPAPKAAQVDASQAMPSATQSSTAAGQTGEAGQEQGTPTKPKRNRGRPKKEFEDFFITPDDAPKVIPILKKLLKGKFGRDAARIIAACCHGGWISRPTATSIEREFGVNQKGLTEPLRCHYDPPQHNRPKFPKFTTEELEAIAQQIRDELPVKTQPETRD